MYCIMHAATILAAGLSNCKTSKVFRPNTNEFADSVIFGHKGACQT